MKLTELSDVEKNTNKYKPIKAKIYFNSNKLPIK